jgi:copper resistance protein B
MKTLVLTLTVMAAMPMMATAQSPTGAPAGWSMPMMGDQPFWMIMLDRLEYGDGDHGDDVSWEAQGWYGGDYHKLWVESEGHLESGNLDDGEVQLLYDRTVSPFWSTQVGIRHDFQSDTPDVSYLSVGVQGLAPQWLETDVAAFVSEHGDVSLRGELEYDLRLTRRLILQPRLEINASLGDAPDAGLGDGLNSTQAGVRLRYEIRRELAPYLGIRWSRLHGDTRDLATAAGEPGSITQFVIGVRAWL